MRRTHSWSLSKHFRITLYIKNSWERGDDDFILIKMGGAKINNKMLNDYRGYQVFPLRYECFRHAQTIQKYALSNGPYYWNNVTVEELEEDMDCNSSVCK